MCSSTLFVNCEQVAKDTVEKILCRTQFRSGHMLAICAGLSSKGKVGVQRGRKTAGCPSFLPPRRAPQRPRRPQTANSPAEVQRKTSRPLGTNTLTQFAHPGQPVQEKRAAPSGRTRLRQFARPGQSVQEKEPPRQGEPACGSSCAPVSRCRKKGRTQNLTAKPLQTLFIATR